MEWKEAHAPDPRIPASLQYLYYEGSEFTPEKQKVVEEMIAKHRYEMDLPFDELYHKQKKVVQDVIDAEKALQEKIASLPDPYEQYLIDPAKLSPEDRSEAQDLLDRLSSPFNASQRRKRQAFLDSKLNQIAQGPSTGSYKFDYSETADLKS